MAKALIGNIQKYSTEDGPGIRTTVFLKGCPLNCRWCHNPELIRPDQQVIRMPNSCIHCGYCLTHCPREACFVDTDGKIQVRRDKCDTCLACADFCYAGALRAVAKEQTAQEVMREVVKDREFYDRSGGGMTLSGGELLTHGDFCREIIALAAEEGIPVCLDTSGYGDGDLLFELASQPHVTDILFDMKSIDDAVHRAYTGRSNGRILANLRRLAADPDTHEKLQMRMPLIHGVNDTEEIIARTADLYGELGLERVTLLPYHDLGLSKMRNIGGKGESFTAPSDQRVEEIKARFSSACGMQVEILGKV